MQEESYYFRRKLAIELRTQGQSYSQIKQKLNVSKSTLSLWLRSYPLSKEQLLHLETLRDQRVEKFRQTMQTKREARSTLQVETEQKSLLPLTQREIYISGLLLYWGEGLKSGGATVSLSNTNPQIMKFFRYWLTENLHVPIEKLKVRLHLYEDMDPAKELLYWSTITAILPNKFLKPYIKTTTLRGLSYKGFGHGTCEIRLGDVKLKEKILAGIHAITLSYNDRKL